MFYPVETSGEKIKKHRMMADMSQQQLADSVGMAQSALAKYEAGGRNAKADKLVEMARAMQADPLDMLNLGLTDEEEIRIFNKLLIKYAIAITSEDDEVKVRLPKEFKSLQEVYAEYQDHLDDAVVGINMDESPKYDELFEQQAKDELDFWLETWPAYDYIYQGKVANKDPEEGGAFSIKSQLKQKCMTRFFGFQDYYLTPLMNKVVKERNSMKNILRE